ncbi:hypothetical protein NB231_11684 [Nitrococcus mobilis Nb-231]|uniref:Uncharacterized protein n=1 Tax=Nitrococcus mobilis Nb-231 TaxID=314278 RepID=A4BP94_9GAMM|nr:hypothetical protein NB231_11684 [Nitrococcus mobilis Nb-231]
MPHLNKCRLALIVALRRDMTVRARHEEQQIDPAAPYLV